MEPTSLELPERQWGSLETDFIVHLAKTRDGYDAITTWVDGLTRSVHLVKSKTTDTAVDIATTSFQTYSRIMDCMKVLYQIGIVSSPQSFGNELWNSVEFSKKFLPVGIRKRMYDPK